MPPTAPLHHVISLPFESCLSHNPFFLLISLYILSSNVPVQSSFPLERGGGVGTTVLLVLWWVLFVSLLYLSWGSVR